LRQWISKADKILPGVSGFFETNNHDDEGKAKDCSNHAAYDGGEYRNTASFKDDERINL
jgi:hypothetical protein